MGEISRVFAYSLEFYLRKVMLIALFSIPFFVAFLIPLFVPAPTYLAGGGLFVRTGSLPEFSENLPSLVITVIAYMLAMFIISDTIVNINILVRSKRTLNETTQEMLAAMPKHAMRIFYVLTAILVLHFLAQLFTHDVPLQTIIYPLFSLVLSYFLFFVPPAVVIDNSDVGDAILRSVSLAVRKPLLVLSWLVIGALLLFISKVAGDFTFSGMFSQYFVLLLNSIIFLPFLIVLQTQMYMEKYPLAR